MAVVPGAAVKRGGTCWTVDWTGGGEPAVGHVVCRLTPTNQAAWWRVKSIRVVHNRKPLRPGYTARYRMQVEFITDSGDRLPSDGHVDWTLHAWPREKKPRPSIEHDRFSPLL